MTHDQWVDVAGIGLCLVAVGAALGLQVYLVRKLPAFYAWLTDRLDKWKRPQ